MALLKRIKIIKEMIKILRKLLILISGKKGYEEFALDIKKKESSNRYDIINIYGYLGAYQFSMARLCDLGYTKRIESGYNNEAFDWKKDYNKEYFLNNSDFQDKIFKEHCINLIEQIEKRFPHYIGLNIKGINITLSGLVAGAHLGGIGGIGNFLIHSIDTNDQLATRVSDYIKEFKGYNLTNI